MAGGSAKSPNGTITGINVTPLVDITLVLLIVFMVTAKLIVTPPQGKSLDLPNAATGTDVQEILGVPLRFPRSRRRRASWAASVRPTHRSPRQGQTSLAAPRSREEPNGDAHRRKRPTRSRRRCALQQRWSPALDFRGNAIRGSTTVNVRFDR
jgi:hypothetical protein